MKKIYVDLKHKKKAFSNNRMEQLIWIFDIEKRTPIPVSLLSYSEKFCKKNFEQTEGEYLAVIAALDYPDYRSQDLEILSDSQSIIKVLENDGKAKAKFKPYINEIKRLSEGRTIIFGYISREENLAGFKAEGNPANKELRDLVKKFKSKGRRTDVQLKRSGSVPSNRLIAFP